MTRLTRLTLRAILVLGVLSSGALAAPASTLPLTNDQALDQCSDSQIGRSPHALRARGCMSSREGANEGGANGGRANGEGGSGEGGSGGGGSSRGRARAYVQDRDVTRSIIEPFNQCMSDLGRPDLQTASSVKDILEIVPQLQVPAGRLEAGTQRHEAYVNLLAVLSLSSSRWLSRHSNLPSNEDPYHALVLQIQHVL
ncbi:hypothetical protein FB446DRAFT_492194 [Lentinula raphanica]|nr:hypothetical protein FB446DRAFT_492194 [Lentinula raphanica]